MLLDVAALLVAHVGALQLSDLAPTLRLIESIGPHRGRSVGDQPDEGMLAKQRGLSRGQQASAETQGLPFGSDKQGEDLSRYQIDQTEAHHLAIHLHYPGTGRSSQQFSDRCRGYTQVSELFPSQDIVGNRKPDGEQSLYIGQGGKPQLGRASSRCHEGFQTSATERWPDDSKVRDRLSQKL